ncbi:hypothetical protein NUH30_18970 [Leptospira sp. 85282-16]|uniref:DUF2262 domain-containing protein n=1 Tax=Leptospira sp. 85282-16 TaxID=2971256 RepID=UPI0021BF20C1|nr:DUF2262 domain-containing protein [Leptospira sp. 85282-16]MCT8335776.1 hypothetical protein [Leptospira sp. 85282-16]
MNYINLRTNDFKIEITKEEPISVWIDPKFQMETENLENKSKTTSFELILCYSQIKLDNIVSKISFSPDNVSEIPTFVKEINLKLNEYILNQKKYTDRIVDEILKLKNRSWLSSEENKYTKKEIMLKFGEIKEIYFNKDFSYSIFYNDNQLFLGHYIEVRIKKEKITEITLAG